MWIWEVKHKLQKLNESGTRIFNGSCFMEVAYQKNKLRVGEQTKLYIFSDGVYEVEKSDGSMWQFREFADFMNNTRSGSQSTLDRLHQHAENINNLDNFEDDFTIVEVTFG